MEAEGEQDRLEVSSFLYSVQPCQESWWRQRESKTGWRFVRFWTLCNLIRRAGGGRGRARHAGGE